MNESAGAADPADVAPTETVARALRARDRQHVWHGLSGVNPESSHHLIAKGEGSWVTDIEGNRFLDAMAGQWSVNVGYGRRELAEVAFEQMLCLPFYPMVQGHVPAIELAEKISAWLGGDYVVFFTNSGSEANELAFKIARQYHQQAGAPGRWKFISRYRNFHGIGGAALAATGQAQRKYRYEPLAPGFVHVAPPDRYRCGYCAELEACNGQCSAEINRTIGWELAETVAGVIIEPVITGGGVIVPPEGYNERVAELCATSGALLIVDEVICGFGRTGRRFGFQHDQIRPDLVTMAKGLTSSYVPLAATAVRRELYEAFDPHDDTYRRLRHVSTFGGHPVACAVALRNLQILEEEGLAERSERLGVRLLELLRPLWGSGRVGRIQGRGLLCGVELVTDQATRAPAPAAIVDAVLAECRRRGVIFFKNGDTVEGHENVIVMAPPLNIAEDDLELLAATLIEAVNAV